MLHRKTVIALGAALLCAGCESSPGLREPWVYGTSRTVYGSVFDASRPAFKPPTSDSAAMGCVIVLVLPFALDTLLLPITVPRDLIFLN